MMLRLLEKKTGAEVTSVSEVAITPIKIPIVIEENVQDINTAAAVKVKSGDNFATAINWTLKETNIETEKTENIKTLKSCLQSENKTKIPISIKIAIRHENPGPPSPEPTGCQHQCQPGGGRWGTTVQRRSTFEDQTLFWQISSFYCKKRFTIVTFL
jgi:hypothetical protein